MTNCNIGVLTNNFSLPTQASTLNFSFIQSLDTDYLDSYYQGNVSDAAFMYDVFLNCTVQKFYKFIEFANSKNFMESGRLAHQMVPTFMLVGLTNIASQLKEVERSVKQSSCFLSLLQKIVRNFTEFIPIVLHQKVEIDAFLSQQNQ